MERFSTAKLKKCFQGFSLVQRLAFGVLLSITMACFGSLAFLESSVVPQNLELGVRPPSAAHWFGTDLLGRDLLLRTLQGGRVSLSVGVIATGIAVGLGVVYGMISGWLGGRVDRFMMRSLELVQALPFMLIIILLVTFLGRHFWLIFVAIGAVEWPSVARVVRGEVLWLKQQAFVEASRSLGCGFWRVALGHLLPNLQGLILVYATLTVPSVILLESFLGFLGLGVQAPLTSWGELLRLGTENLEVYPWLLIAPALLFSMTLLSLNILGDALRDGVDPRDAQR